MGPPGVAGRQVEPGAGAPVARPTRVAARGGLERPPVERTDAPAVTLRPAGGKGTASFTHSTGRRARRPPEGAQGWRR
jgi:hypothetical protein